MAEEYAAEGGVFAEGDPCSLESLQDYNLGLHIGSVFILLAVSLAGSLAPVALRLCSAQSSGVSTAIKLGTYFGFGTLLSTAFIHMLLPAAEAFVNPCLPTWWTTAYEAWAYFFVTLAVLVMHLVDYLIKGRYQAAEGQPELPAVHDQGCCHAAMVGAMVTAAAAKEMQGRASSEAEDRLQGRLHAAEEGKANEEDGGAADALLKHDLDAAQVVGIYLAEAGIIFHSVMIGLTLGVTAGTSFLTLLVALCFHQFFEGLAIGTAAVDAGLGSGKTTIMGLAYSVTTPVGIAIGIAVRGSFNQNATRSLLTTGILDSLSAGILVYVALINLINPMMTNSRWLRSQRWPMQVASFAAFYAGAGIMAVIGKWA